jgi:hypothetical protein
LIFGLSEGLKVQKGVCSGGVEKLPEYGTWFLQKNVQKISNINSGKKMSGLTT